MIYLSAEAVHYEAIAGSEGFKTNYYMSCHENAKTPCRRLLKKPAKWIYPVVLGILFFLSHLIDMEINKKMHKLIMKQFVFVTLLLIDLIEYVIKVVTKNKNKILK